MESIQQQISALTQKVDRVYQILARETAQDPDVHVAGGEKTSIEYPLNREDTQLVGGQNRRLRQDGSIQRNNVYPNLTSNSNYQQDSTEWIIAQQDILIDSSGVEISHRQIKEQDLAPQIQIQRLTAQLTAAYNRIAALEEQLLAKRWK
jgi:ribosomal protein L25 (general stress protein Ctc)